MSRLMCDKQDANFVAMNYLSNVMGFIDVEVIGLAMFRCLRQDILFVLIEKTPCLVLKLM